MTRLLQIEIYKIFKRQRTYLAFVVIAAIIFLIQIGLRFGGKEYVGMLMGAMGGIFEVPAKQMLNGYFVCFFILNLLLVHVPILVALVAGDMISGESNLGTLRLLASKPISRTQLCLVKFGASVFYTLILLIWVALLSLFLSMLIFGTNSLYVPKELEANIMILRCIVALFCSFCLCCHWDDYHRRDVIHVFCVFRQLDRTHRCDGLHRHHIYHTNANGDPVLR
jgi:ABC-2 type transport system permease protein